MWPSSHDQGKAVKIQVILEVLKIFSQNQITKEDF